LKDLSISRVSVQWGIPVPDDPKHTIYVWLDALSNYITALGWGNDQYHDYERYWPALHLVGKHILRFHTVYWPAFLMAAGLEVPHMVYAHGMWLSGGRRMSKTLGNGIEPAILHRHFTPDMIRYFVLREMVFGQDGDFTYEALINRVNADLASGVGNLSSRTLTMIHRYANGRVPSPNIAEENYLLAKRAGVDADSMAHATVLEHARNGFVMHFDDYAFSRAVEAALTAVARTDKLISDAKPWDLAKDQGNEAQRQTLNAVLYRAAETLRWLAVMLYPVMPEATGAIWRQLGQTETLAACDPTKLAWGGLTEGGRIGEVEPIFPRIDKRKTMAEIEKQTDQPGVHATQADAAKPGTATTGGAQPEPPPRGATEADAVPQNEASGVRQASETESRANIIEIDDFAKVELRVGQVLTAERVPKSDKLLRFTVDLGEASPRQILAGIAQYYEPEPLVGRKIVVVANLKPRKLRGFESQGMVLAASVGDEGRPVLATFTEDVPNGARLK
ncbi:MAG: methionine--tRNA ligase subunit beta, partial [Pyrinomonadaceae bacterium]|nr:methionine--tRNA ligase subunit beta [Pyrinomonadaceae bacterium]